jgi:DNA modification methylase
MDVKVFVKDSTQNLSEIGTNTIDLIVTSPPYWDIIDYGHPNQVGKGLTYKHFFRVLEKTFLECMRVVKEDSFIALIVGDVRKSSRNYNKNERARIYPFHSDIIKLFNEMDFEFFQHFIWQKTSVKKGEKGKILYGSVGRGEFKDFAAPPLIYTDLLFEHILVFRKPGNKQERNFNFGLTDEYTKIPIETAREWMNPIWKIDSPMNKNHRATFPLEIAARLIKLFSYRSDTILDPFCGTGTLIKQAVAFQRKAIGYELNENYLLNLTSELNLKRTKFGYSN